MSRLTTLPPEIHSHILSLLPWEDQILASSACSAWTRHFYDRKVRNSRYQPLPMSIPNVPPALKIHQLLSYTDNKFYCKVKSGQIKSFGWMRSDAQRDKSGRYRTMDISNCPFLDEPVFSWLPIVNNDSQSGCKGGPLWSGLELFRIGGYIGMQDEGYDGVDIFTEIGPEWLKNKNLTVRGLAKKMVDWIDPRVQKSHASRLKKWSYEIGFSFSDLYEYQSLTEPEFQPGLRCWVHLWHSYLWRVLDEYQLVDD